MSFTEQAQKRGCYCSVWDNDPKVYEKLGYPIGFCGFCERCGKPGHARHFPGAIPYTGCWCDYHYQVVMCLDPRGAVGCMLWMSALLTLIGFFVFRYL